MNYNEIMRELEITIAKYRPDVIKADGTSVYYKLIIFKKFIQRQHQEIIGFKKGKELK